ncbi:MAG: MBL fold metallo-hydrolase [Treponema sp.]|nr:MBL fold metallo-hydrolase [Treponema sp.]
MNIHFWGVRGSIPSPLTPAQIQAKITAVVQRISPKDLESLDARQKFISSLPQWLYGTIGGNTPCVQLTTKSGKQIILDAGSGIRVMGKNCPPPADKHYSVFFSHFHWDHIQGFPFFDYAYYPDMNFDIYSPFEKAKEYLVKQMDKPNLYPVDFNAFTKNIDFHTLEPAQKYEIDGIEVQCCMMSHPGDSFSYSFVEDGKKIVYATDVELTDIDNLNKANIDKVFRDADVVILDSQYTLEEASKKEKWGHSAFCYAIDFAVSMNIKTIYLFHHEPTYDDKKIDSILQAARWYAAYISGGKVQVKLAVEGQEIEL